MFSADWVEAAGTWFAAILVAISLPFLWAQVRDLRRSMDGSTNHIIYQTIIDIDRFFAEHPNLRPYFYDNKSLVGLDEIELSQVLAVAEMLADCFDDAYQQQAIMSETVVESFKEYVRGVYQTSPALREYIKSKQDWYIDDFTNLFKDVEIHTAMKPSGSPVPVARLHFNHKLLIAATVGIICGSIPLIRRIRR